MLGLFGEVAPKVKSLSQKKVRFDSVVFRLHYRVTCAFLLGACLIVTATEFIGDPIQCIVQDGPGGQFGKAVATYCWISSTYTLPEHYDKQLGIEVPHPGVGPYNPETVQKKHHAYYQWVPFVLLFQAILFYFPHFIWRNLEKRSLSQIIGDLNSRDISENEGKREKYQQIVRYLAETRNRHTGMFLGFIFCELLTFIVVVGNIAFTDLFLGGEFRQYGAQVISFMGEDDLTRTDPLTRVFPRVTKCDWHFYGPSGTIQKYDALCVLAINIINEKVYVFLWFWFVILAAITGVWLIVRAVMVLIPAARRYRLMRLVGRNGGEYGADDRGWAVRTLVGNLGISDWFVVLGVGDHMDPLYYPGFVTILAEEITNPSRAQRNGRDGAVTPMSEGGRSASAAAGDARRRIPSRMGSEKGDN